MSKVGAIYRREMKSYFVSPTAYIILTVFFLISGFFFYHSIEYTRQASVAGALGDISVILLLIIPFITMPLIAEERRTGTIELLFTSPVTPFQVVMGKYLAALSLVMIAVAGLFLYAVLLALHAPLEVGVVVSGYLGILLLVSALVAAGVLASSLAGTQIGAGLIGIAFSLFLFVITRTGYSGDGFVHKLMRELSPLTHYLDFRDGVFDFKHFFYFLLWAVGFIAAATKVLEAKLLK